MSIYTYIFYIQVDIWSLGITLIEFAQMEPPNHEMSPMRVLLKIQKSDPPKLDQPGKWSKDFNDFIAKALIKDPTSRPTADELLKHSFINRNLDSKPIRDLLLEYKADVVEEELVDEETEVVFYFLVLIKVKFFYLNNFFRVKITLNALKLYGFLICNNV